MNETPAVKKLTSTEARIARIEREGAPELVRAVKEGKMGNWTATHLITDKWPLDLQSLVCCRLFGYEPMAPKVMSPAIETSKAVAAADMKKKGKKIFFGAVQAAVEAQAKEDNSVAAQLAAKKIKTPLAETDAKVAEIFALPSGYPIDASGKVDTNVKPVSFKKGKKVKAVKFPAEAPTEEDAFEASVNASINEA